MSKYEKGLDHFEEAIFSDHYITRHSDRLRMDGRTNQMETIHLNRKGLELIADINREASQKHINWLKQKISTRIENKELTKMEDIIKEIICERQFTRGARSTCNWNKCTSVIRYGIAKNENIECIIVGLPFKMPSILKCSSTEADMGEASFLLQLYEFCKVSEFIIRRFIESEWKGKVTFRVISDAIRFMDIVNISKVAIDDYRNSLGEWIKLLKIQDYIEIKDYTETIEEKLTQERRRLKTLISSQVEEEYKAKIGASIKSYELHNKLQATLIKEPDPEKSKKLGRFVSLYLSLLFTMNYKTLSRQSNGQEETNDEKYIQSMKEIIGILKGGGANTDKIGRESEKMLNEAWTATIKYIAEIRSDRDMNEDIIEECFPDCIRWTIHKKNGQICIASRTVFGINLMPWHGVAMLKESGESVKQYVIPYKMLEEEKTIKINAEFQEKIIPVLYLDKDMASTNDLYEKLQNKLTRKTNG
ncbi:L-tyrosine/L-tryptophan isonitrile synthase family protein [Synechococcus sp. MU1625]|uniref:L-tyrosine/L-tryptophan isonitrile synthase family protein n=1 Tax=Synechococcus sp. MU1625 TaxID=2508347 RepID=UPI001CF91DF4|nr:L-tyrosine/L-tryptophan isonitrile synthase family protein [Synechococcus sp. MU1625]MCB4398422.1 L-tyrosine/L-tryptophan isonitrile synthase family protein [Synechococcus sp. MU1625]